MVLPTPTEAGLPGNEADALCGVRVDGGAVVMTIGDVTPRPGDTRGVRGDSVCAEPAEPLDGGEESTRERGPCDGVTIGAFSLVFTCVGEVTIASDAGWLAEGVTGDWLVVGRVGLGEAPVGPGLLNEERPTLTLTEL